MRATNNWRENAAAPTLDHGGYALGVHARGGVRLVRRPGLRAASIATSEPNGCGETSLTTIGAAAKTRDD